STRSSARTKPRSAPAVYRSPHPSRVRSSASPRATWWMFRPRAASSRTKSSRSATSDGALARLFSASAHLIPHGATFQELGSLAAGALFRSLRPAGEERGVALARDLQARGDRQEGETPEPRVGLP